MLGNYNAGTSYVADSSINKAIEAAEAFIRMGEYSSAKYRYEEVTEIAPQDYRGWWGLIVSCTNNFTTYYDINLCEKWFKNLEMFAPLSVKTALLDTWQKYYSAASVKYTEDAKLKASLNDIQTQLNQINIRDGEVIRKRSQLDYPEFAPNPELAMLFGAGFIVGLIWMIIAILLGVSIFIPVILMSPTIIYLIWYIYKRKTYDSLYKEIDAESMRLSHERDNLRQEEYRIRSLMEQHYNEFVKRRDESIRNCLN